MKYDPQKHHRRSIRLQEYDYSQPGAYFVTICTYQREPLFGQIVDGEMHLSPLGEMVKHEWFRSAQLRREIVLHADEFVIMPNHLHGIVHIVDGGRPVGVHPGDAGNTAYDLDVPDRGARCAPLQPDQALPDPFGPVGADSIRPGDLHDSSALNQSAHRAHLQPDQALPDPFSPVGADGIRPGDLHETSSPDQGANRAPLRAGRSLASFVAGFKASVTSRAGRELNLSKIWQRNYYEHIVRDEAEYAQIHAYIRNNPLRWEVDQLHPATPPNRFKQETAQPPGSD